MPKIHVVISYDLKTPPGLHSEFIQEMQKLQWSFNYNGRKLPNTTCYASFNEGSTEKGAASTAESDIKKAEQAVQANYNRNFKVDSYYIVAFPIPTSVVIAN